MAVDADMKVWLLNPTTRAEVPITGSCEQEGRAGHTLVNAISHDMSVQDPSARTLSITHQGLTVTAVCTSCHTSHLILPHTDERSSIHVDNVAATSAGSVVA